MKLLNNQNLLNRLIAIGYTESNAKKVLRFYESDIYRLIDYLEFREHLNSRNEREDY